MNGASFGSTQNIVVTGRAMGDRVITSGGDEVFFTINRVEVYNGTTLLGNATLLGAGVDETSEIEWRDYSFTISPLPVGSYTLKVRAVDNYGSASALQQATITVANSNASPTVTLTSPATDAVVTVNTPVSLTVNASDPDGTVAGVQYFANNVAITGVLTSAPFTSSWTPSQLNANVVKAVATDNLGASTTSATNIVTVNDKPTSAFTVSNINNQNPGSITLNPTASDSVGGIAYLTLYVNGSAVSSALSPGVPYNLTGKPPGTYNIVIRAVDNYNAYTDSTTYAWVVNAAPSVSIATPANGTVSSAPGSFTFTASASDSDGSISSVQYFNGATAISGSISSAPYSFTWSSVAAGTYNITARATDNGGGVTTSAAITVISNDAPAVSLNTSGAVVQAPGSITLQATASDSLGGVSNVKYLANGNAISGALTGAPYAFNWTNVAAGTYSVVARATDGYGRTTDSSAYSFTVNAAPSVSLTSPANGSVINTGVPASISMAANASDGDGSVSKVEFLVNGNIVATSTAAPFTASWSASAAGAYSVQARATDNAGGVSNSAITLVTVDAVPTTAITSPANGATFQPGWDIPVTITAGDSDGSISKVELYKGGALVATLTSAPYATTLADTPAGTYVLTAKAYDNQGAITTSAAVTVNVAFSAPPTSSGSGIPGKLAGALSVSGGGAAQYAIPIAIPPGTAGVVPTIALNYDSSGGNGVAGVGWSINGLSQITRCGRDFAHEGLKAGVDLTANDRFCLDGQRLILVSGTYGLANSEYRTEIDNFSKIVALDTKGNGPDSFLVTLRDGTKLEYGSTADSQLMLPLSTPPASTTPMAWSLNKVSDARGNYYTVTYATATGQQMVTRIDYTGNTISAVAPYNSVRFVYDTSRTDVETRYVLGAKISTTARLTNIQTYSGSSTLVKDYRVAYGASAPTSRSRVQTVTECADTGSTCLPPTTFTWENTPVNFSGAVVDYPTESVQFGSLYIGDAIAQYWIDVNGDGRPDRCVVTQEYDGDSSPPAPVYQYVLCALTQPGNAAPILFSLGGFPPGLEVAFADIDGDGISDICVGWSCHRMGATGPTGTVVSAPFLYAKPFRTWFIDLNGDGRADYCTLGNTTNNGAATAYLTCYLSAGTAFGTGTMLLTVGGPTCTTSCGDLLFDWADITGDGVPSFCRIASNAMRCQRWTSTGLAAEVLTPAGFDFGEAVGRAWVDVNGDGKADLCRVISTTPGTANGSGTLTCTLSTGVGFGDTITSATVDIGYGTKALSSRSWQDINGDSKADYCRGIGIPSNIYVATPNTATTDCILSTGNGFSGTVSAPTGEGTRFSNHLIKYMSAAPDGTGDGKPDVCYRVVTNSVAGAARCLTASGGSPDLLLGATDGLGATVNVDYLPISDSSVYTKGTGATFPTIDLQDTTQLVQRVQASNGVGGTIDSTYKYEGAKVHLQGRGFLGFTATSKTDATGTQSRVETNTAFPLTGTTARTVVSNGTRTLSETIASYSSSLGTGLTFLVYPTSTITKTWDLDGTFTNWTESSTLAANYDTYGNPLQTDTVSKTENGTPDGYSQTSVMAYSNDTTNWILGRPTSLTTTSRIPNKPDSVRTMTSSYVAANPGLGLLQQNTVEPSDASSLKLVSTYTYDNFGNVLNKDVSGPSILARTEATYTYDAQGRGPVTVKNALNQLETRSYDWRFGGMASLQGPNLLTTSWSYDLFGRKLTEDRADGTRTTIAYNPCAGCVPGSAYSVSRTETVIASGATADPPSRTYYDTLGRSILRAQMGFNGQDVYRETVYDSLGRVGYSSSNYFASDPVIRWTQFDYDVLGRTVKTTAPDNTITIATYTGRTTSTTNHNGVKNSRTINSQGKVVSIIDAEGTSDQSGVTYEYDHWGNLTKTTDALNNVTSIEYDLRGRKTRLIDPDMGTWLYTVDNLGLVKTQTDNKSQVTTYVYDLLDRLKTRTEPNLKSDWYYDTNAAGTACPMGIGKLCEATSDNPGYFRRYTYDSKGRLTQQKTHIDVDYDAQWLYNAAGKLETKTFPASLGVAPFASPLVTKYNYNANGYLQSVTDNGSVTYWTRNTENADGNILTETYGNGLIGTRGYDSVMRRLTSLQAGPSGSPSSVQNQGYHYDSLGRLDQRQDSTTGVGTSETFGYDNLNRLTTSILTGPTGTQTSTVGFNAIGNITSKSGVGNYAYNPSGTASVRPHAVSGVTGTVNGITNPSYGYDNNGNMLTDGARSFTWTSFNMPATLTKTVQAGSPGAGTSTFLYGPEHQRLKQTWVDSSKTLSTYYLSEPHFEKEVNSQTGITEYKHYISVGSRIVAIQTRRNSGGGSWATIAQEDETFTVTGTQTVRYGAGSSWITMSITGTAECSTIYFGADPIYGTHKTCEVSSGGGSEDIKYLIPDHLGSTSVVTDASGAVLDRQAYDPWGDRRTASGSSAGAADPTNLIQPTSTDRGYTGHEHLDQGGMGLVHMNGRVYDPTLGRFISADPNIQAPFSSQSFGRFGYVSNSPLNATDPSGFYEESETARRAFGTGGFSGSNGSSPMTTIYFDGPVFEQTRSTTTMGGELMRRGQSPWECVANCGGGAGGFGFLFGVTLSEFGSPERAAARTQSLMQIGSWLSQQGQSAATGARNVSSTIAQYLNQKGMGIGQRMLGVLLAAAATGKNDEEKAASGLSAGANSASTPPGGPDDDGDSEPKRVTNPKHHPNSKSPEPKNVDQLYENSVVDKNGVRWAKDADGTVHRFSKPSNGETHWNGSTGGVDPIQPQNIPVEIRRMFGVKG